MMIEKFIFQQLQKMFLQNETLKNLSLMTVLDPELSKPLLIFIPLKQQNNITSFCIRIFSDYKGVSELLTIKQKIITLLEYFHINNKELIFKYQACEMNKDNNKTTNVVDIKFLVRDNR